MISLLLIIIFSLIIRYFFLKYLISKNKLNIKCGFFTYKPIEIKNIKKLSSNISSSAVSFNRIDLEHIHFMQILQKQNGLLL
jgi:uncharacterized membrane protein YdbT with pleckstrin-like domain